MTPRPKKKLKSKECPQVSALISLLLVSAICLLTGGLSYSDSMDAPLCRGDFDSDGDVDAADLVVFSENYGRTNCSCQQVKFVKPGESIQSVIDSIKDASADKPYIVVLLPGVYVESARIDVPRYIDIIGSGKARAMIEATTAITSSILELDNEDVIVKGLKLTGADWGHNIDLLSIKDCRKAIIENITCRKAQGNGIAIDHSVQFVSKCLWIKNFDIASVRSSAVRNKGLGYARVYIDGGHISTNPSFPEAHGIEGHFVGSIKNIRMTRVGGSHFKIHGSQVGLTISDCHLEQAVSGIGIHLRNCNKVIVRNIAMWSMPDYPMDYAVYLENCQDCIIESCLVSATTGSNNHVSFYADADSKNNTFRNNRVINLTGNQKKYEVSACNTIIDNGEIVQAGMVSLQHWSYSELDSSAGAITGTLPDGTKIGQRKTIVMTDATASSTVSVTHHETSDPEVGTFDAVDEFWILEWMGTKWVTIKATCSF